MQTKLSVATCLA